MKEVEEKEQGCGGGRSGKEKEKIERDGWVICCSINGCEEILST